MSQSGLSTQEIAYATNAFRQAAHFLANLRHQNLPGIYDYFSENGCSYLVMEIIEGETLAELLEMSDGKGLLPEEVLLIGEQLCSVLGYLHTRHPPIIFRDIKPSNVMLSTNGDHLYLIDFGIARLFKTGQIKDTLAFGTAGYAPPEQYHAQTDERSDIYSLGVTLHQLLTAWDPTNMKTSMCFPPIHTYNPETPPLLEALILQMVEADPMNRPASMLAIKQEIQRIRKGAWHDTSVPQQITPAPLPIIPITRSLRSISIPSPIKSAQGKTLCLYRQHSDSIHAIAWSPDGKRLVSGSRDKTVHVWEADTGNRVHIYKNHTSFVYGVAWSLDGQRIASTSFKNVHLWDATTGNNPLVYSEHSFWVYAVDWAPNGLLIATCSADGEVHLWNALTAEVVCKYQGYPRPVKTVAWSHNAQSLKFLSGCEDGIIYCWDVATENSPVMCQGHKKEVCSVAWSPDGTRIASAGEDKTVRIWDVITGNTLYIYHGHGKEIHAVAWSPNGLCIATAGKDRVVRVWHVT